MVNRVVYILVIFTSILLTIVGLFLTLTAYAMDGSSVLKTIGPLVIGGGIVGVIVACVLGINARKNFKNQQILSGHTQVASYSSVTTTTYPNQPITTLNQQNYGPTKNSGNPPPKQSAYLPPQGGYPPQQGMYPPPGQVGGYPQQGGYPQPYQLPYQAPSGDYPVRGATDQSSGNDAKIDEAEPPLPSYTEATATAPTE